MQDLHEAQKTSNLLEETFSSECLYDQLGILNS
jgi:hypothetical protein